MSGKPAAISNPHIIFQSQLIQGFWIFNWFKTADPRKIGTVYRELASMVASGDLRLPVAGEFKFEQFPEALAVAARYNGKAILRTDHAG